VEAADTVPGRDGSERELAAVLSEPGPFLTVVVTTDAAVENAAQHDELRWKSLRSDLADGGVPERVLAHVDPLVADAHLEGRTLVAIANEAGVAHVEPLHQPVVGLDQADAGVVADEVHVVNGIAVGMGQPHAVGAEAGDGAAADGDAVVTGVEDAVGARIALRRSGDRVAGEVEGDVVGTDDDAVAGTIDEIVLEPGVRGDDVAAAHGRRRRGVGPADGEGGAQRTHDDHELRGRADWVFPQPHGSPLVAVLVTLQHDPSSCSERR
jgi:hypothetical protein